MKRFFKTYWKTLLFFAVMGLAGGYLTGLYLLDSYPTEIVQQIEAEGLSDTMVGLVTAVQYAVYGVGLGAVGIVLGRKVGLWKDERHLAKKPLLITLAVVVLGGVMLILPDMLIFGRYSQAIADSYAAKPTVGFILGAVMLGGVIEEVMLRLFMLSLLAFILHKLFERKRENVGTGVLVTANVVAGLLFAAGHLPATALLFGELTPMLLLRCFLLNGGFGLAFGWLYRRYGLRYAMIAHAGCHVVSKLIWILFI